MDLNPNAHSDSAWDIALLKLSFSTSISGHKDRPEKNQQKTYKKPSLY